MEKWLKEMYSSLPLPGLLGRFEDLGDWHGSGMDRGPNGIPKETKVSIAKEINRSVDEADAYINTTIGMQINRMKTILYLFENTYPDTLSTLDPPNKECKALIKDLQKSCDFAAKYLQLAIKYWNDDSRLKYASMEGAFIAANELKDSAINRYISLGGKMPETTE